VEIPIAPIASPGALPLANGEQAAAGGGEIKGSILYIEDNPANVLLMEQIARRLSIRFVTAHNAEMGITLAVSQQPDLVVMDINLPQMNGYEALRCLRENPVTAAIPVIALSANAMPRDVARGLEAGFLRYHTQPIDIETMMTSIRQILGEPK
jgi:CheY-like chemotaxis protein